MSLDVFLPDMLGWTVLSQLKRDPATRHIPVQIVTLDEDRQHGLARGAFAFVGKPDDGRRPQHRAVADQGVRDAAAQAPAGRRRQRRRAARASPRCSRHDDIDITTAGTGTAALIALREQAYDCAVLDLRLPDMSGFDVLETIRDEAALRDCRSSCSPARSSRPTRMRGLRMLARSVVVKGVESPDRLLDETALFLHRVIADLPEAKRKTLERLHGSDEDLIGKQVLVVDDDVRNIFALRSVLERRGMTRADRATRAARRSRRSKRSPKSPSC